MEIIRNESSELSSVINKIQYPYVRSGADGFHTGAFDEDELHSNMAIPEKEKPTDKVWGMPKNMVVIGSSLLGAGILTALIVLAVKASKKGK